MLMSPSRSLWFERSGVRFPLSFSPVWLVSVGSFHRRVTCGIRMTIKGYLRHMEDLSSSYLAQDEKIYLVEDMCGI